MLSLLIGCGINSESDINESKGEVSEDSIIKQNIKEAIEQGAVLYKVNEHVTPRISMKDYFQDYFDCLYEKEASEFVKNKFGVHDTLRNRIKDFGDYLSSEFIRIENPMVVYGTNSSNTTIFSIYSPEVLTDSFVSQNYHFGVCLDISELDSMVLEGFKDRYKKEFADVLIVECEEYIENQRN